MITLPQALEKLLPSIRTLASETAPLAGAAGRYLAADLICPLDLPPFDNSAMDGYAVRAADLKAAASHNPTLLEVIGKVAAGECFTGEVAQGQCVRLFTGSPLPKGADAVIMQEATRAVGDARMEALEPVEPWENVRFKGEDVKKGIPLLRAGALVEAGAIGLLGACGMAEVQVGQRAAVALLATGSELREPGLSLEAGAIYESNRAMLAGLCAQTGSTPRIWPIVADDLASTRAALSEAFRSCDVVITSGGVSVGEFDFVKTAFEEIGGEIAFWRVAIRPGKPFVFGKLGEKYLFGLPGNPVSAFVTFLLLVRPALLRMQGAAETGLLAVPAKLTQPLANPHDRAHFVRVRLNAQGEVRSTGKQASHMLSSLAAANALVEVPPQSELRAGEMVSALLWQAA